MKLFKTLLFFLFIMIATVSLAYSQQTPSLQSDEKRISFTVNGGVAIPVAPFFFRQNWNVGPGIEAGIGYRIRSNSLLRLNVSYYNFGFTNSGFQNFQNLPPEANISSSNAETMTLGLNAIYEYQRMETDLVPYLTIGAGLFRFLPSDIQYSAEGETTTFEVESETSLMFNSGIGFLYPLRQTTSVFLEAKLVTGLFVDRRTQYIPISFGIRF
ncbi:MAG TPA: hypothetical protein DCE78_12880 [Bacteroidetes bacterium]|nr:hypothetical protein [Bacteroidota bacterium]